MQSSRAAKLITGLIVIVLIVLLIIGGVSAVNKMGVPKIEPGSYQSVVLDTNQQYFGHLQDIGAKFPYLTDIYYVRAGAGQSNPILVKLGGELHGPTDIMYLNSNKIIFWENLRPDSIVVRGIAQEKAQRAANQQAMLPPVSQPQTQVTQPASNVTLPVPNTLQQPAAQTPTSLPAPPAPQQPARR